MRPPRGGVSHRRTGVGGMEGISGKDIEKTMVLPPTSVPRRRGGKRGGWVEGGGGVDGKGPDFLTSCPPKGAASGGGGGGRPKTGAELRARGGGLAPENKGGKRKRDGEAL